ncbi:sister chromatid cohesion protein PDS5 homolog E-like [Euphorbia lathyris]|uniref:sister chromatid cohesion protein PDS5 homolog E-like n=1 Tax=Euphorbia lathyris TaxID=212925 RepID=UPI0033135701
MAGKELQLQLLDDGHKLLNPPFSIDDLLSVLDRVEVHLKKVNQSACGTMVAAVSPLRNALVSDKLLKHSDTDVKVSVAVCISEIMRITAPDAPYSDEQMKEIFHLFIAVFWKLSHMSSRCYSKVVSVLVTVAKTRVVVVMVDLECHALIIEMFQLFLTITRSNNSNLVTTAMVGIMTIALLESDDIPLEIVIHLLASVRKGNQNLSPTSWKLGREVMKNCATKISPYILKALNSIGDSLDNYDQLVSSICQNATDNIKPLDIRGSGEHSINYERPAILRGKKTRCKTTYANAGTEEINYDKGQSMDFPVAGCSLNPYMQQSGISTTCLSKYVSPISSQNQQQNQEFVPSSIDALPAITGGTGACSGTILVQGYEVKTNVAPILRTIFAKYGDIAADCLYKSPLMRASLLEIVCNVVLRLQQTSVPFTLLEIKIIQNEMKELEGSKLKISWLTRPLEKISEIEKIAEMHSVLKSVKANSMLVIKAASKELEGSLMELVELQKRMGEAEKRISAMKLVVKKVDDAINEAQDRERSWVRQINELL